MNFKGIIVTGTPLSSKTTVVEQLNGLESWDGNIFERTNCEKKDIRSSFKKGNIPVIEVCPEIVNAVTEHASFMVFFLDASNDQLKSDIKKDNEAADKLDYSLNKCEECREHAHYIVQSTDEDCTTQLIIEMWNYRNRGGALSSKQIKLMIQCGMLLKDADTQMINGASYDLRLGDEYYYGGEIRKLSDDRPFLTIEPYDYAIVSCAETAWMPKDVIAKFGLTVGLFCQGIILSNGPQIDPGFRGTLFCLLFNTSNRSVNLKRGKHYATIEFNKMIDFADSYKGQYQDKKSIIEYIPENALYGAINELKKEVTELKRESHIMQNIYLGVLAVVFAMITLLLMK